MPGTITVTKTFRFEAAHHLPLHDGECQNVHGHSWVVEVAVCGPSESVTRGGPKHGMLIDYSVLGGLMNPLLRQCLDHHDLNETTDIYPTSEHLAEWIYERLRGPLREQNEALKIRSITVHETTGCRCTYEPEP